MAEVITLELPDSLAQRAKAEARRTNRPLEAVLIEWLHRVEAAEPAVESLPDAQVLALSDSQMEPQDSKELSDLLARNREGQLDRAGQERLETLMQLYRSGLVRKAQALQVAVARGLKPPLN